MSKWIIAAALFLAAPAFAQPMQCGTRIINPGDSMQAVLDFCGVPTVHREWTEVIPAGDDDEGMMEATRIPMAEWIYAGNPDQFTNKVLFQNGYVKELTKFDAAKQQKILRDNTRALNQLRPA